MSRAKETVQLPLFKVCNTCGKLLGVYAFHRQTTLERQDKRRGRCKVCRSRKAESADGAIQKGSGHKDLTGEIFGHWKVLGYGSRRLVSGKARKLYWDCECMLCGKTGEVDTAALKSGRSKSCGCLSKMMRRGKGDTTAFNSYYGHYRATAKSKKRDFDLTKEQFRQITQQPCEYCGAPPDVEHWDGRKCGDPYISNGLDRVNNDGGYTLGNVVPCCRMCNVAKHNYSVDEFYAWIERVYRKSREN